MLRGLLRSGCLDDLDVGRDAKGEVRRGWGVGVGAIPKKHQTCMVCTL